MEFRKAAKEARKQKDFYRTFEAAEEVLACAADAEATIVALDKNIKALFIDFSKRIEATDSYLSG